VSRFGFLLIINLMFLVLGCFLDTLLMLLVIVPIVMPSITGLGIDKVHFGVTTIVNLMIGMITPPYSELLFVVTGITGISLTSMYRYIWPFIIALVVALFIMLAVPDVVLWLPIQFGYTPGESPPLERTKEYPRHAGHEGKIRGNRPLSPFHQWPMDGFHRQGMDRGGESGDRRDHRHGTEGHHRRRGPCTRRCCCCPAGLGGAATDRTRQ